MTIPVVDPYYRVEVDAGSHSWVTEKGDPAGYGLADPLRVGWSIATNNPLFHAQPDPMTATFSVVVADMAEVADLGRGAPVVIRVYGWPPGTPNPHVETGDLDPVNYPPIVLYRGRISDPVATPHKLGMTVTYTCVDYTVDLAERTIGAGDWPEESVDNRLGRMFDEAGVPAPVPVSVDGLGEHYFVSGGGVLNARAGAAADARSLMWKLVDQVTGDPDVPFDLYYVMTTDYAAGYLAGEEPDPLAPYAVPYQDTRLRSGDTGKAPRLPGVFAQTSPGRWGVDIVEHAKRRAAVITADHVDFKPSWRQNKSTDPDRVTVTGTFTDTSPGGGTSPYIIVETPDSIPVGASVPCDYKFWQAAESYARANLRAGESDAWVADGFTWYADQDPWPMVADGLWFVEGLHVLANRYPIVVSGIDPTRNPTGLDWYAGRLRSATFTLAKGRYTVAFQLQRSLLRPLPFHTSLPGENVAALSFEDLRVVPTSTVRYQDLDTSTHFDARLLRSP